MAKIPVKKVPAKPARASATQFPSDPAPVTNPSDGDGQPNDFEVDIHGIILMQDDAETPTPLVRKPLTIAGTANPDAAERIVTVTLVLTGPNGTLAAASQTSAVIGSAWRTTFAPPADRTVTNGTATAAISAHGHSSTTVRRFSFGFPRS